MTRPFESLSEKEVLALAVHIEQENAGRFRAFADIFRRYDDAVAARFEELASEEEQHEELLVSRFKERFGGPVPEVKDQEVVEVIESPDLDEAEHLIFDTLKQAHVYRLALRAEQRAQSFYQQAAASAKDPKLQALYRELEEMENDHTAWVEEKLEAVAGTEREGDS